MKGIASLILALIIAVFPSPLKILVLRLLGAEVGRGCKIGFSILHSRSLSLGDNVQIASFNLIHRLDKFQMGDGARMNGFNWVTGAGTGSLLLGHNSAITRFHFFEASGDIEIGDNTIIAGRNSHFFTHGISPTNLDDMRTIKIGDWCYVGSSSRFVPGASIEKGTFVAMGAVVSKVHSVKFVLLAGIPASQKKLLSETDAYFARSFLPHDHHPIGYGGGRR
jgi:acetyltransferase-like isoleucine patch superfamily enzyme